MSINPRYVIVVASAWLALGCSTTSLKSKIDLARQQAGTLHDAGKTLMKQGDHRSAIGKFRQVVRRGRYGRWTVKQGFVAYLHYSARDLAECHLRLGEVKAAETAFRVTLRYPAPGTLCAACPHPDNERLRQLAERIRQEKKRRGLNR